MNIGAFVSIPRQWRARVASLALAIVVAVLALPAPLCAQDVSKKTRECAVCKGVGWIPCEKKACKASNCNLKMPHDCSQIYGQECCRGTGKILCPRCKDPVIEAELSGELDRRKSWLDRMRKLFDEKVSTGAHVETEHWILHTTIPNWKVGEITLNRDKTAHLFAERLEIATMKFRDVIGVLPPQKQGANLVNSDDEHMKATLAMQGVGQHWPYKTLAPAGIFTTRPQKDWGTDEEFHSHVIHNGAHLLTHACFTVRPDFCPWFHEAMSHWIETAFFPRALTFCSQEVAGKKDHWTNGDWRKLLYSEVAKTSDEPLATIMTQDTDKLSAKSKAHGWSFLDFLIKTKPEEFKKFYSVLKNTNDTKKAMDQAFGWSTATFQEKWRDYVRKAYAP